MLDVKMTDVKLTDQCAGHENAGHENAGHEIAGQLGMRLRRNSSRLATSLCFIIAQVKNDDTRGA